MRVAFETGVKKWIENSKRRNGNILGLACMAIVAIPYLMWQPFEVHKKINLSSSFYPNDFYFYSGAASLLSLVLIRAPFVIREEHVREKNIYKQELELLKLNVELEYQESKLPETELLLKEIEHAIASFHRIKNHLIFSCQANCRS